MSEKREGTLESFTYERSNSFKKEEKIQSKVHWTH